MFFFFSNFLQLKILLFSLLLGCVASDIGGFIVGNFLKGPKLTKISPKKTISGAIGSVIFTGIVISGSFYYFTNSFSYKILIIAITAAGITAAKLKISPHSTKNTLVSPPVGLFTN